MDIETEGIGKPISVVGVYRQKQEKREFIQLVQGVNLCTENIREFCKSAKLIVSFNGIKHDLPRIKSEFPNSMPDVPILDVYLIAKKLGFRCGLKRLEQKFGIRRMDSEHSGRIAVSLWKRFKQEKNKKALQELLDYNRQDTVNLIQLADELSKMIMTGCFTKNRIRKSRRHHHLRGR